ncbi:diphosphomevalonate decarboxylase [Anopheles ziemanni]|uniref:diphosphomevalonate decarboxylase n=1 Tax=Anopheles coustani TaxID=139045 RepID=UPI00265A2B1F|nr:diphosphomevalonate decarboxylase [Anopheles coustani]XP_058174557.1 diphosphomevalonate decarboxylase [Anopheles ziemanni]
MSVSVTCIAPVNIAIVKYWGKRDDDLILPINDSLSVTLSTDHLRTKTTITAGPELLKNVLRLNGVEESFENPRIQRCLLEVQKKAKSLGKCPKPEMLEWKIHVESENNFPTAAGLASSAAGYACFVYTLATLYGIEDEELSSIARMGSGSACRSLHSGYVQWVMGEREDGTDSLAVQVAPATAWPDMHVLILVVNDRKKATASTQGMSTSVKTSELLKHRVEKCVPQRIEQLKKAIAEHDFETFGRIAMTDSNQFHGICLDTYPPCFYMNDVSRQIVRLVHEINNMAGFIKVAYSFDAGPNACLFLLEKDVAEVSAIVRRAFPFNHSQEADYYKGIPNDEAGMAAVPEKVLSTFSVEEPNQLRYIIHTKVGEGPRRVE